MQISVLFKWALLLLCLSFLNRSNAQSSSFFTYSIRVDEVDFLAPHGSPSNKLAIHRDYDPHPLISGLAWKYPSTENPVAFVSGTSPKVYAKFDLAGCTQEIWAKGDGPGAFDPVIKKLESNGEYPATPLPVAFPSNKVDFYEPFDIVWYISTSASGPWIAAGKSSNPLYITYASTPFSPYIFHSVIYYGCKNAKGLTDANSIVDNMYSKTFAKTITNLVLPRKDKPKKSAMSYWAWPDDSAQWAIPPGEFFTTEHLLKWENGRCESWSRFFIDMITIQGISGAEISEVTFAPTSPTDFATAFQVDGNNFFETSFQRVEIGGGILYFNFYVKDFDLNSNKFYKWDQEWNPSNWSTTAPLSIPNGNVLNFAPMTGSPAQGNADPMSMHVNHAIVKYNGKYYDPSYGFDIKSSANDWETTALAGFGSATSLVYHYLHLGIPAKTRIMWLFEKNNNSPQATINP